MNQGPSGTQNERRLLKNLRWPDKWEFIPMLRLSMEFQTLSDPFDSRHRIPKDQCKQTLLSFSRTHMSWWQTGVSEGVVPQPHLSRLVLQNCPSPKGTRLERSQYRRGSAQGAHLEPLASKSPLRKKASGRLSRSFQDQQKGLQTGQDHIAAYHTE